MKILLFGKNGQVGWELNRSLQPLGEMVALGHDDADFSRPEDLRKIIQSIDPGVVINAAAYTAVDKAEEEEELAAVINGIAPGVLAEEARLVNALLVHYSTDYVFDGTKTEPYVEDDIPNPINAYGRSKLAGEKAVTQSGCDYLIFRTAWVYSARGKNFLKTMLQLSQKSREMRIVADQYGAPTWARNIADVTAHALQFAQRKRQANEFASDTYHLCAGGKTSWHGFSSAIIERARQQVAASGIIAENVLPIATEDYPLPARRPTNSVLDSSSLSTCFGLTMPKWHDAMKLCIDEVLQAQ